jgi:transposase
MGCEAHEDKARARTERMAEKRKNRQEGKRVMKAMRLDAKRAKKAEQAQSQVQARPHGQVQPKEFGKGLERMDLSGIRTTHGVDWDEVEKAVDAEEEAIANAAAGS